MSYKMPNDLWKSGISIKSRSRESSRELEKNDGTFKTFSTDRLGVSKVAKVKVEKYGTQPKSSTLEGCLLATDDRRLN
ncbi:hypothetical protein PRIPAC_84204 [Pristionchus pacificus]|uniref:Uncharacterized protein n=1 Tax=Pristionchus pacificus TaxID=54126 RepID=A0A2A6BLH7_PRIPA|nr:hypothetical protein PRIPAC_84204 [Pristionchus pacificus]|eukprot:PDM66765.1 hypothetical protein PRIPAC_48182 [Pristionchus pacificus]